MLTYSRHSQREGREGCEGNMSEMTDPGFIKTNATILQGLFKDHIIFLRTTYEDNSQTVQKGTFPVYSNRTLGLELFASPTSLHFSVHLSKIDS